jgi:tetratricopeptide (TPR) repeat protein
MTPKFGGVGIQKPGMAKKDSGSPSEGDKGLVRKDGGSSGHKISTAPKGDKLKPLFGDVADENIEEALAEVAKLLEQEPSSKEHHIRRFKLLRKKSDRPAMRSALQAAAKATSDSYFGVKLAEALEEEGSFTKALEWRKWVAQFQPNDTDTIRRLAATSVRANALQVAEATYSHLIELRRNEEAPLGGTFYEEMLGKGLQADNRKQLQEMGLRLIAKALKYQGASSSLLEAGARLAYRVRNMEMACAFYEQAIQLHIDHRNRHQWKMELLKAQAHMGRQTGWKNLSGEFIEELKSYLHTNRTDTRAWATLAQLQIQAGMFEDALKTLRETLATDSKNAQALWDLGRLYVRMGRSAEAVAYYEQIINDPNEKKSVRRAIERTLGDLHFKTGNYAAALELYEREAENNMRMIAPIYEALGQVEVAEQHYLQSVKQSPRDARSHLGVAEYWVRRKNWEAARQSGAAGVACTYATEEVHSNLAVALATAQWRQGENEAALQTMEEICQAYPDSIQQVFRKAKILKTLGRQEDANALVRDVRQSAQLQTGCSPASSQLWSLLGDCAHWFKDYAAAKVAYSNAIRYDAMDSTAVRGLGLVARDEGDKLEALKNFTRSVVLDPLNLATPTVKSFILELEAEIGPLPVAEPEVIKSEPAPVDHWGQSASQWQATPVPQQRPAAPVQPQPFEGGLGGSGTMDWFE